jgi:DNA-binding Lrp family transcriptional regulator
MSSSVRAYVFLSTEKARVEDIATAIRSLPYVRSADVITGQFDVIVLVEAPELGMLWTIVDKAQSVPGVTKTTTNLVVE